MSVSFARPKCSARAVRFLGEPASDQKRAKPGAADVDDMLEVNDQPRAAGLDQVCKPFPESSGRVAVDAPLDFDDRDFAGN